MLSNVGSNAFENTGAAVIYVMPGMRLKIEEHAGGVKVVRDPSLTTEVEGTTLEELIRKLQPFPAEVEDARSARPTSNAPHAKETRPVLARDQSKDGYVQRGTSGAGEKTFESAIAELAASMEPKQEARAIREDPYGKIRLQSA